MIAIMIDQEIKQKEHCMGCYACANICPVECILMENEPEGFRYPKVDYNICIKCIKCIHVCPILNKSIVNNQPVAYACINNDESIRRQSSSGGVFTLLAEQIIDKGGVVFGAAFDENLVLQHRCVEKEIELEELRGSKYLQSQIGNTYNQAKVFVESGLWVLFSGTPCQIGGLKSYLGKSYENLISVDFICHGVPSPLAWQKYVKFQEINVGSSIRSIAFRRKDAGWKQFSVSLVFKNNAHYLQPLNKDLYMKAFLKDICLRPSCHACKFKSLNRRSDITLADFWGVQNMLPEMDDDQGTSLIFVNSFRGQEMFDSISSKMKYIEVDINEAVQYNSAAIKSVKANSNRENFFRNLEKMDFDQLVNKYCKDKLMIRIKKKIKSLLLGFLKKLGISNVIYKS